jgi:type VI secretion system secreted protein Hcp
MKTMRTVFLSSLALLLFPLLSHASVEVLMKLEGINIPANFSTQSKVAGFDKGYIQIMGASAGIGAAVSSSLGGGQREVSKPSYSDFNVTKRADEITPALTFNCASGKPITKVTIVWVNVSNGSSNKPQPMMEFMMENVYVSGLAFSGSTGSDTGDESVSFAWGKMTIQSYHQDGSPGSKVVLDAEKSTASI